jgi:periplasmic protein TonB
MILESRASRRTRPDSKRWSSLEWSWNHAQPPRSRTTWIAIVSGGLVALSLMAGLQILLRHDSPPLPSAPEWVEMEPPRKSQALPVPRSETTRPTAVAAASREAVPRTSELPTPPQTLGDPTPSDNGSMTTAQGTAQGTTVEELPPAPIAPQAPTGPVSISGVPASVAPLLPGYPARAEAEGREGTVVALVVTDTLGRVVDLRIEKSAGRDFDESVRRAALASRFVVPRRDGKALAVAFRMPYRFRLD